MDHYLIGGYFLRDFRPSLVTEGAAPERGSIDPHQCYLLEGVVCSVEKIRIDVWLSLTPGPLPKERVNYIPPRK